MLTNDFRGGRYMIFKTSGDVLMGHVLAISDTYVRFHPWSFLEGCLDLEQERVLQLADIKAFHAFKDVVDMDHYCATHYWNKEISNDTK